MKQAGQKWQVSVWGEVTISFEGVRESGRKAFAGESKKRSVAHCGGPIERIFQLIALTVTLFCMHFMTNSPLDQGRFYLLPRYGGALQVP
ncbi:hypothetical protein AA23498_1048 [Acetobacter nitrogenifigens DSM 23921 = NBRC 105050]|uniref:Uncharacterized protein n=1 Tax=Acetobacter nitrogenifigens DSM 23921 = NBRC 105050 TaxID=1120919 RepID=A0A511XAQ1_9PROT|nr:hypothetical protein AA23498_1048 [Acetobacter nitrogenifigens DSM 23921 = NBRC 105050]GEN60026.1 hypothetical protein ANI02nite_19100 [Acetobacter nitrogenifigens DSM 23921 = NBRC 105050]